MSFAVAGMPQSPKPGTGYQLVLLCFVDLDEQRLVLHRQSVKAALAIQALVAAAQKPKRGLILVEPVDCVAVGHPVASVVRSETAVVQRRRTADGFPARVQRQADEWPGEAQEGALDRDGRLDQLPSQTEIAEGPDRISFSRPRSAVPLRRQEDISAVFGYAAHLEQRRLRIGDVLH